MPTLREITLSALAAASITAFAVSPYPQLEVKADRFFHQKEWAQAAATYDLMLDERPHVPATYGRAIVSSTMAGDTLAGIRLFSKALDNHVPFDSVFSRVRSTSFELGRTDLYERLLLDIKAEHPWMRRTANAYLLRYYSFRRDGANMVAYADIMLQGSPDNIGFLSTKAQGLMLTGATDEALATYDAILTLDPDNYQALLELGNWYALRAGSDSSKGTLAAEYLRRAYGIRPTPHVEATLRRIGHPLDDKKPSR
ncbi:MAG: hypothetical protein K2G30_11265 [Muribaculaceae bacterium]|nr:hypothetical protein [Muribaculaceae bacterium]